MKFVFTFIAISGICSGLAGQNDQFFNAIRNGNISVVSHLMDNRVEVSLIEEHSIYSKAQAVQKVNSWLTRTNPISVQSLHGGESADQKSFYQVAKLTAAGGTYRIFVYFEKSNSSASIKKIQIDPF
ncbi:MAG TPA: DUF4783 domain-containing protein [Saprospiraceae bacterium]|nr:DUF4783 domain-containing protein [Saprospiraceae bacterium]